MYETFELCTSAARTLGYEELQTVATMSGAIPDGASEPGTLCTMTLHGGPFIYIFLPQGGGPPIEIDNDATP